MEPYPLPQVESGADGQVLPLVRGTLATLYESKAGTSEHGDWSFQNGAITDGNVTIPVQFKDRDAIPQSLRGKVIEIQAKSTDKHGLTGLKIFDDTYKGKTTRKLRVTQTADVRVVDAFDDPEERVDHQQQAVAQESQQPTTTHQLADQQQPADKPKKETPEETQAKELNQAKFTLVQVANLHVLCRMAVIKQEVPIIKSLTGTDMSEGEIQSATSSLFIKMDKLGMHNKMPRKPFTPDDFS